MKNTFENAIEYRFSHGFEFCGYDENGVEVLYTYCKERYEEVYKVSLEFANRFITSKCCYLIVKDLFINEAVLNIYRAELLSDDEHKPYEVACQIITKCCEV